MPFQNESVEYGGLFSLTCILREGNITYARGSIKAAGRDLEPDFVFAAEISNGDYVSLHIDTGNTPSATGLLPVVAGVIANTEAIIGRVTNEPEWSNAPQASQDTWTTMLAAGYYRTAVVEFTTVTAAHSAFVEGTTDVQVAVPLKWDLSLDAWVDAGTGFTGAFSFHYCPDATPEEALVGFGPYSGTTGADDTVGSDVIA